MEGTRKMPGATDYGRQGAVPSDVVSCSPSSPTNFQNCNPSPPLPPPPPLSRPTRHNSSNFFAAPEASSLLVDKLLGASTHQAPPAGTATPYGMIVRADMGSSPPSAPILLSPAAAAAVAAVSPVVHDRKLNATTIRERGLHASNVWNSIEGSSILEHPPKVPDYADLKLVYSINHIHVYRGRSLITEEPVVLKLCVVNHLDTLGRLRLEWQVLTDPSATPSLQPSVSAESSGGRTSSAGFTGTSASSVTSAQTSSTAALAAHPGIVKPISWDCLPDGGMMLVYSDKENHVTVNEAFLPGEKPLIVGPPASSASSTSSVSSAREKIAVGSPLAKPRTQSDLIKVLLVFSHVVSILEAAHRCGVTHNNINTSSILVQNSTGPISSIQGKLGGWHLASKLEREDTGRMAGGAMLRGENPAPLQYIAPECTGRMNRTIDYRADFYSLGVALYELTVGFLPFRSVEALELIHMHIAQPPKPPHEMNASIPRAISEIIMKLLQKNAEDRYQTASGLKADLDLTMKLLSEGKPLDSMNIGELDTTSQFVITEKLYGREDAVNTLKEAYRNCLASGGCTMVTIRGPSGVGKSRLVNEIQRPVVEKQGFFTSGKFDQYKRGFSFFTLIQTLQDLIRQVLSESPASLTRWRTDTIRAFDGDAAVLVAVIPELKLLLGPDFKIEPLVDLGPAERENRFRNAFGRLLAVFGRKSVVMFLDDLQWCSQSEFMLIANVAEETNRNIRDMEIGSQLLPPTPDVAAAAENGTRTPRVTKKQSRGPLDRGLITTPPDFLSWRIPGSSLLTRASIGILIIAAYRDTDVPDTSPMLGMLQYMKELSVRIVDIQLAPLDQESVRRIIGDTLHRDPESGSLRNDPEMQTLTELVYSKTAGNPFFVVQLLKSLYRSDYITFEFSRKGSGGRWRFNLTSMEAEDLPTTVVDLLVAQMLKLPETARVVMMLASCIGTERISLGLLATASAKRIEQTSRDIWGSLEAGLILVTSGNYRIHLALERGSASFDDNAGEKMNNIHEIAFHSAHAEEEVTYRFLHDRVRQAAYSLIPAKERAQFHRTIGRRMLEAATPTELNDGMIYEVVNQLNHWLSPLEPAERRALMVLNLRAGNKALQATAFPTALDYFLIAKQLLDDFEKEDADRKTKVLCKRMSIQSKEQLGEDIQALGTDINISLMEAYFADVKYTKSIELAEEILPRCTHRKDKVRYLINKMNCLLVQGKYNEAIESGLQGLCILDWEIPMQDAKAEKHAQGMKPRILLSVKQIRAIYNMHELVDENLLLLQEIISTLILPVSVARPPLLAAMCYTSVAITLEHGVSIAGTYPLLMTGVLLGSDSSRENLHRSYAFGRLAISLIERDNRQHALAPAIYEVYAGHIGVFHQPMSEVLNYLQQAVTAGMAVFNVDYTIFAMTELTSFAMLSGENLHTVQSKMMATRPRIKRLKQESGMWWLALPFQFLLNLRGLGNPDPLCFEGEELGNSKDLARLAASESLSHIFVYHMYRLILTAIYGRWQLTADIAMHCCEPISDSVTGTYYLALSRFYAAVAFYSLYDTISDEQKEFAEHTRKSLSEFGSRAKGTWLHKSLLLEAEAMRVSGSGQQLEILDIYDQAIFLANKAGLVNDAAFINERCGMWLLAISKRRAPPYLREAFRAYNAWGASHKASELRKSFQDDLMVLGENRPPTRRRDTMDSNPPEQSARSLSTDRSPRSSRIGATDYGFDSSTPVVSSTFHGSSLFLNETDDDAGSQNSSTRNNDLSLGSELDFRTVLKASLVISEGIHLEEVIVNLMKCVLQTAGADYGVLILKEDGELHIETVGLLDQVSILEHEALALRPDLVPISVVNIVATLGQIVRNGDDPKFELTYGRDTYFQARRAKSVLCMPIQNQLKTMGVLYLENKMVTHAFTRQRQELLNLLCTQAAVTIEKARLYRQMELAKKAAEDMTEEKSSFLANMSHEIRTPFNALLSCSIFLLDTSLSEQQREYVETIRNSAVLTLQIIDGILDFSKIEHGAIDLLRTPFSLRDCVETALQLVAEPAATKDIELAYRNQCSNINMVHGDITRFRQCIINMIGNAVKFTQEGHVVVTTEATPIPGDTKWEIHTSVKDTGIGIPTSAFNRLFRAFSQVDTSTRRTFGGTGLGLAISKKLAQMMGGDIWFESEEGKGSTFHFTITADVILKTWTTDKRLLHKHAMVADTHPISSNILADELEREGLHLTRTRNVPDSLTALRSHPPGHYAAALIDLSVDPTYGILDSFTAYDPACKLILMSRFGSTIPTSVLANKCTLSFVRPAPRARYVDAVIDALNPSLPAHRPPRELQLELMKSLSSRHPLHILLAEDNPVNTRVALQHLKRLGYSAAHAKDGIEVLEMCEEAEENGTMYDVVLMDVQMPRADGLSTTRELYKRYSDEKRPTVVALTANATAGDREECHRVGMAMHIAKPILPNDLAAALMSVQPLARAVAREEG